MSTKAGLTEVLGADYQPGNADPVAPSAVAISNGQVFSLSEGKMVDYGVPRALEKSELPGIVEAYVQGAKNALKAGQLPHLSPPIEYHCLELNPNDSR